MTTRVAWEVEVTRGGDLTRRRTCCLEMVLSSSYRGGEGVCVCDGEEEDDEEEEG